MPFFQSPYLIPLFTLLDTQFRKAAEVLLLHNFILDVKYTETDKHKCQPFPFIVGQMVLLLSGMSKARV